MLCWGLEEKQRSFASGDFWVLAKWQVNHFQFLSVFQDGGTRKCQNPYPGEGPLTQFLVGRPPPTI